MGKVKTNLTSKVAAIGLSLALAASVVGCSGTTGSSSNNGGGTASNTKEVKLKLITWTNEASVNAIKALNDKIKAKYPEISVDVATVDSAQFGQLTQTRIAAGDVDIITHQYFSDNPSYTKGLDKPDFRQYIESGAYLDLTDQPFVKNWDPNSIKDACTVDGKVYAIDIGKVAMNGLFYNKKIFDDNGLKVPQTWDEFVKLCETLQSKGIAPITGGGKDAWPIGMFSDAIVATVVPDFDAYAKGLWTGETKLNDATGKKIFERMDQFASFYEKDAMGVDYASVPGRFVAGKAAMLGDGTWQAAQISKADPNFKFGYFTLPGDVAGSEPQQLYGKYDLAFSIYGKTKNKDAALKYLDTLSQKDVYTEFVNAIGFIPTMPGVTVSNEYVNSLAPLNKNFHLAFGINAYKAPKGVGKYAGFQLTMLKRLGGEADPDKLADMAQADWDAALKNAK